jgi:hypothetical protein
MQNEFTVEIYMLRDDDGLFLFPNDRFIRRTEARLAEARMDLESVAEPRARERQQKIVDDYEIALRQLRLRAAMRERNNGVVREVFTLREWKNRDEIAARAQTVSVDAEGNVIRNNDAFADILLRACLLKRNGQDITKEEVDGLHPKVVGTLWGELVARCQLDAPTFLLSPGSSGGCETSQGT